MANPTSESKHVDVDLMENARVAHAQKQELVARVKRAIQSKEERPVPPFVHLTGLEPADGVLAYTEPFVIEFDGFSITTSTDFVCTQQATISAEFSSDSIYTAWVRCRDPFTPFVRFNSSIATTASAEAIEWQVPVCKAWLKPPTFDFKNWFMFPTLDEDLEESMRASHPRRAFDYLKHRRPIHTVPITLGWKLTIS